MVIGRKQMFVFLAITFSLTYMMQFIVIAADKFEVLGFNTPFGLLLYILSTLSPTVAGFLVLKKNALISGVGQFTRIAFSIKQKPLHYGLVLLFLLLQYLFPAIMLDVNPNAAWYVGLLMIVPSIFDGGLEELGWRYILQPTLEKRFSFFIASLIVCVVWILWHVPFFFVPGTAQSEMSFLTFSIMVLGNSFALAAIYRISASVWLCILFHASYNAFSFYWPAAQAMIPTIISAVCLVILSTSIVYLHSVHQSKNGVV